MNFLCITLAVTPLVRSTGWAWWMKQRRMLGLFAAFYASLHFLTYLTFDLEFEWGDLAHDIAKRPFILVGFLALVMIEALAVTSTDGMIRRLRKWWSRLHTLIYPAAMLGVVHYYWLVKSDHRPPLRYAAVVGLLLGYRVAARVRTAMRGPIPRPA